MSSTRLVEDYADAQEMSEWFGLDIRFTLNVPKERPQGFVQGQ